MKNPVEIENIEEMRRREGIDDVELRMEIRALRVGDLVKLTFITGPASFETLSVRITSMRGTAFRGKLASRPASSDLRKLGTATSIVFSAAHIHSLMKRQEAQR